MWILIIAILYVQFIGVVYVLGTLGAIKEYAIKFNDKKALDTFDAYANNKLIFIVVIFFTWPYFIAFSKRTMELDE